MTSARLCTDDQDGAEPTSASASRIASGGASMTTSRDACTATNNKVSNEAAFADEVARLFWLFWTQAGHHLVTQPVGRGVEHDLARPPDDEAGDRSRRLDGDVEAHPGPVDT